MRISIGNRPKNTSILLYFLLSINFTWKLASLPMFWDAFRLEVELRSQRTMNINSSKMILYWNWLTRFAFFNSAFFWQREGKHFQIFGWFHIDMTSHVRNVGSAFLHYDKIGNSELLINSVRNEHWSLKKLIGSLAAISWKCLKCSRKISTQNALWTFKK